PDFPVRLVAEFGRNRLPGHEGLDDARPAVLALLDDRQREDRDGSELRQPERLALVDRAVPRGLEALAELVVDLARPDIRPDQPARAGRVEAPQGDERGAPPEEVAEQARPA